MIASLIVIALALIWLGAETKCLTIRLAYSADYGKDLIPLKHTLASLARRRKFLIGGIIVSLAIAFLGYMGFTAAATYYYEVSELLEQGSLIYDENVRVNGQVVPGSLEQESVGGVVKFTLIDVDGAESLPVVYQGVVPDTFKAGNEVVVEGYLNSDGIFQGHTLMPKCASRYVPA